MNQEITPQLWKIEEAGKRLSLSRSAIWREMKAGKIKFIKIGKAARISEQELQRYISSLESE